MMGRGGPRRRWPRAIASLILSAIAASCVDPDRMRQAEPQFLFYLHGKVVEDFGPRGVNGRWGAYDYPGIIEALRARGFEVVSEVRPRDTDPEYYADRVVGQIRAMIARGVAPARITVVGASKGGVIAALVSSRLREPRVRHVLLASCNDWLIRTYDPHLTGEVLSIYETSDDIGQSCATVLARSPALTRSREIKLSTGLGHGIVYRPLEQWVGPASAWALGTALQSDKK